MKYQTYSHHFADKIIDSDLKSKFLETVTNLEITYDKGMTRSLRNDIKEAIELIGWSESVEIVEGTHISITSYNDKHGLCLQTGNMSRFYADIIKLQHLYLNNKIKAAFYLLPSKQTAKKLGSNIAHFDRFTKEIDIFKKTITVPILVIGME